MAAALAGCGRAPSAPAALQLSLTADGPDTRLTLVAAPHIKINARIAPALELSDGKLLRFTAARLTPDSAYFAEPPSTRLPGRHERVHGTLRASVCEEDERVCRTVKQAI